jgi:hypothetical protein
MPSLSDNHVQAHTGRLLRYWVTYGPVSDAEVFFACAISEPSRGPFGRLERGSSFDGTVPVGADCAPVELAIRSRVLSYIDRTDFGHWMPPPPSWRGWYGLL